MRGQQDLPEKDVARKLLSGTSRRAMTEKLPCGRPSTCELCSRCLLAEMLFKGRTWLPHPSVSWVGGLTTLCDRVQSSREGLERECRHMTGSGAWLACNTSGSEVLRRLD